MDAFDLQFNLEALQDVANYTIPDELDVADMDPGAISDALEATVEPLAQSPDNITDPQVFNTYRSLLKNAAHLRGAHMNKILDSISSAYLAQVEATHKDVDSETDQQTIAQHKLVIEMYAFLMQWYVAAAEKVKPGGGGGEEDAPASVAPAPKGRRGRGGKAAGTSRGAGKKAAEAKDEWSWAEHIPPTLALLAKVLRLKTQRIWATTAERERLINCVTRPAYQIAEMEQYMKPVEVRHGVYKVICLAVKHHGHAFSAQVNIMQALQYYEHLSEPMAECLDVLARQYDHAQLADEILREIAGKSFAASDSKGPRAFSRFLVRFVELSPRAVLKQISVLLTHLDSEAYPMRMALVEVIGLLIKDLTEQPDPESMTDNAAAHKRLEGLYDLLLERALDMSSYVRAKVLTTITKLVGRMFPQTRLRVVHTAVDCLEDKTANVRRGALALVTKMVVEHPFEHYGGELDEKVWKERYETAVKELAVIEGNVGKVIEKPEDEEEGEEDEEEEGGGGEDEDGDGEDVDSDAVGKKKGKKRGKRTRTDDDDDDAMDVDGEDEDMDEDAAGDAPAPKKKRAKGKKKKAPRKSELDLHALESEAAAITAIDEQQQMEVSFRKKYCLDALQFIRTVTDGIKAAEDLLTSKSKLEVLDAMDLFRVAFEYKIEAAQGGIRKMLHLIWHKDNSTSEEGKEVKSIKARVLECYRQMYFEPIPNKEPREQISRIAKNMIEQTYGATLAQLTSLEELMRMLMEEGHVHDDIVRKLWQVYGADQPIPRVQRRGAIIILGMLALAKLEVVSDRVETLIKVGLGKLGKADLTLARFTCIALQRLNGSAKKVKGSLQDKTLRLPMDNILFRKLQDAVERPCRSKEWFPMAEQAINTVYALGERPDLLCASLIKHLAKRVFARKSAGAGDAENAPKDPDAMDEDPDPDATQQPKDDGEKENAGGEKDSGDAFELAQLLFVVGHVAIKQIVFLELVEREMKRQKDEREKAAKLAGAAAKSKDQEELEQVAGNAEDDIADQIQAIREKELLYGEGSLLKQFGPMLVHICGSPQKFKNRTLRAAATLAFSKFLCVSPQFCEDHHGLLFRIMETNRDAGIRSNIVIALGDVAVSFSSIIDESNDELYKGLRDEDLTVKKNTLMVLTHLILNGMIKVKGQMGEMAKCVEDDDERISSLAKLFFAELSTKDNAIYNNLPDVISHLSVGEHAVDEETFQSTMKYIFGFIEKEKQAENIVEKLCQRFRLTEEPRQWRDIAFCLSLLPFKSERSVKKLIDGLQFYREKLREEAVYDRFQEILVKARANKSANKPETELNEFEQILAEHRKQGAEDQDFERNVEKKKAQAKKRATRRTAAARGKKSAPSRRQDDDDDDDE